MEIDDNIQNEEFGILINYDGEKKIKKAKYKSNAISKENSIDSRENSEDSKKEENPYQIKPKISNKNMKGKSKKKFKKKIHHFHIIDKFYINKNFDFDKKISYIRGKTWILLLSLLKSLKVEILYI